MNSCPAHLNPFRVSCIESLGFRFPTGQNWESLEARLEQIGGRGAVVGPHGSGKTTLVEEWVRRRREAGRRVLGIRLSDSGRTIPPSFFPAADRDPEADIFLDGAEQLAFPSWRRFLARIGKNRGVVITTHKPGRLPLLLATEMTEALAHELVAELLGRQEDDPTGLPISALLERFRGNLREVFFYLYDQKAAADRGSSGTLP